MIEVECGLQGTDQAAENASELVYEFLATMGAIDAPIDLSGALPVFELGDSIPKEDGETYAVHVENFKRVKTGSPIATVNDRYSRTLDGLKGTGPSNELSGD